jgi:ribonuclease HI
MPHSFYALYAPQTSSCPEGLSIYTESWPECELAKAGISGAKCKGLDTLEACNRFIKVCSQRDDLKLIKVTQKQVRQGRARQLSKQCKKRKKAQDKRDDGKKKRKLAPQEAPMLSVDDDDDEDIDTMMNRMRPVVPDTKFYKEHADDLAEGEIDVMTDGGCRPNGCVYAIGTWTAFVPKFNEVYTGALPAYTGKTTDSVHTNNLAELMAAIRGLELIPPNQKRVRLYSDSRYVVNTYIDMNEDGDRGFIKHGAKYADLFRRLYKASQRHVRVKLIWVKGHSDNFGNNIADIFCTHSREALLVSNSSRKN